MIEDRRKAAFELPSGEEERPIDPGHEIAERHVGQHATADERGLGQRLARPVDHRSILQSRVVREERPLPARGVLIAQALLAVAVGLLERRTALPAQQAGHDVDDARRIEHVHGRLLILWRDLHRRMLLARRRAADEQRQPHAAAFHLLRHHHHLVERRRNEAAEADQIGLRVERRLQDLVARDHDAEIDDVVAVAAEHDADDVLADVVHVALHGREHDRALRGGLERAARGHARLALGFHERLEVGDRALHRPGALDDLRQEHLPGAEQVADDLHAVHQRPFDDVERPRVLPARLFDVGLDEIHDAVHERVRQAGLDRLLAPRQVVLALLAVALDRRGEFDHPLGRVRPPVENDVFDVRQQIFRDVFIDDELTGVDDAHVEAGRNRVIEERGVNRFAHDVVPAERERQVADAAADLDARTAGLDEARGFDEIDGVGVVLLETGGDREDVGIENDVGRIEPRALGQQPVRALADGDFPLDRVRLALLVERHHDDTGTVAPHGGGFFQELVLAFLEADRVHDRLALHALQPREQHRPLRTVDHHGHARDLGFGGDVVEERGHRLLGVEHALIHVDVDQIRAAAHLIESDVRRLRVVARADQPREARGTGHVGALTDHLEVRIGTDRQRFKAGELRVVAIGVIPTLS